MNGSFEALVEEFLRETFDESPALASSLGLDGYHDKTGDYSAEGFARRNDQTNSWSMKFESVDGSDLTDDQVIDRDLILSTLRGWVAMRDWEVWRRNPDTYLSPGLSGVFTLFLHRLLPDSELVQAAAARLRAVPTTIEQGKTNLDPGRVSRLFVERALGQCRAGVNYFRNLIPIEVAEGTLRDELTESGEIAAHAFEEFAAFLEKLAGQAEGDWSIGEERYSALLTEKEMLGYGAREMLERGRQVFAALDGETSKFAKDFFADGDWRAVMIDLKRDHFETHEEMRKEFEEWTERARRFLIERGLVTLSEGEQCLVEPSPPFQRPILAVASYSSPPAFKPSMTGHFFVPFPPEGTSEEDAKKRLAGSTRHAVPTTAVHEAYPGHHWHITTMQSNPRRARQVFRSSYFVEGWGLYSEKMMREQGFFEDPRQELCHLAARIFRAARIVIDTSLHIGEMTFEEAKEFLRGLRSDSEATIEAEVGRYCSWPTQAASYLTGSLEIERIRERYFSERRGDLQSFHNEIASTGALPIGLAERALFGD